MSKGIRYDALLVRALAAELDARLGGRRIRVLRFSSAERTLAIGFRDETFVWDLHPDRGWILLEPRRMRGDGLTLPVGARIIRITAPPDERLVDIAIEGEASDGGHVRRIVVELFGTHRNALALDANGIARAVLRPRPTADRALAVTKPYQPLPPAERAGATTAPTLDQWRAALEHIDGDDRARALLATFAWTSPMNARYLLADGDLAASHERYLRLRETVGEAWVLAPGTLPQPYPARLDDRGARHESDLIAAFATAAALRVGAAAQQSFVADQAAALERVRERIDRAEVRIARLQHELRDAPEEAAALRKRADLLLAQPQRVTRGATTVELDDFVGGTVAVELDPALPPHANAARLYDLARKRERAAARLPKLLRAAERERVELTRLESRIATGEATAQELARLSQRERRRATKEGAPLPYRIYRTTGGLEVRVGRSRRVNDELTFHHSSPDDIWLHAESVPGAHVVLRWGKRDTNPPAAELHEAAVLAAVHSRARTSGVVPVSWTRRKYVRKPRKAGPGLVTTERAKTIFVEPSAEVERRLRVEES